MIYNCTHNHNNIIVILLFYIYHISIFIFKRWTNSNGYIAISDSEILDNTLPVTIVKEIVRGKFMSHISMWIMLEMKMIYLSFSFSEVLIKKLSHHEY